MEWRKCYLDVILVPLGFLTSIGYHFWLWHKVRTQPHTTIIGINASGRGNWVNGMMKIYLFSSTNSLFETRARVVYIRNKRILQR
ncbi:hypothetical protein GYH30_039912 [Glycine max]|uniref:Uncharacterized protein n=2 Tax=Glycine subgen. Soja TaxID=1462606 RepID=A0A0R0GCU2_SOYBN|nr:hypothetical protein GYH30_039912 [Glycine max]RZB68830.1 hypothetical protein D0Y65_038556 [Glycine soja]